MYVAKVHKLISVYRRMNVKVHMAYVVQDCTSDSAEASKPSGHHLFDYASVLAPVCTLRSHSKASHPL